jgi:glycosyltransferase involved in cell wall biosynthesis
MKSWPVTVIPNIIDTSIFKPLNKAKCKKIFGINEKKKILLFGAFAGIVNENKGINILLQALDGIPKSLSKDFELVIFGQEEPENFLYKRFNQIKWLGHIGDEKKMCQLYNSSDIVLVPSRLEAFGLVAAEAQACGVPVVAFRSSGIKEVVSHMKTGYLATPFEPSDFASGIIWTIENSKILSSLARKKACEEWSPEVIIPKYVKLYKSVYENFNINLSKKT